VIPRRFPDEIGDGIRPHSLDDPNSGQDSGQAISKPRSVCCFGRQFPCPGDAREICSLRGARDRLYQHAVHRGGMRWRGRICLGRLRFVSIAFDVFPRVFFKGVLLSLETEPKPGQNDSVLRQFRDSKKGLDLRGADALFRVAWARHCRRRKSAARHDVAHLLTTCFSRLSQNSGGPATMRTRSITPAQVDNGNSYVTM
jgi:hypothetical protein